MPPQQQQPQQPASGGGLDSLVADPQFTALQPADQRRALAGVSGDNDFNSLSDADTGRYIQAHQAALKTQSSGPNQTLAKTTGISAQPKPFTLPWFQQGLWRAAASTADAAPAAGATLGSIAGGIEGGPPGAIGGAGMGGVGGTGLQQIMRRILGYPNQPQTAGQAAQDITKQGTTQAAIQAGTELLPFLASPLRNAATTQYERALAPTTKINKAIAQDITPELMRRGESGSLEGLERRAGQKIAELSPQLDQAYEQQMAQNARPPVRGLLPAAPTNIPLGPTPGPGEMPIGVFPAEQYPRSAVSSGTPPPQLAKELGPAGGTIPPRIYRPAYKSTSPFGNVLGDVEQPTTGVMQSRDPNVINQVYPQTGQPYPNLPWSSIKGSGTQVISDLENLKQSYMPGGNIAQPQAVAAISGVQDIIRQYGPDVSPNNLRRLRQIFEDPVASRGGYAGADLSTSYTLNAQKQAADSIREILNKAPDIGALNKEISFWLDVQRVTSESGLRRTGQEGGLMRVLSPLAAGAAASTTGMEFGATRGMEAGLATALTTAAYQAMRSPMWRTTSAVLKNQFANALARGDVGTVTALAARFGGAAAGSSTVNLPWVPKGQQSGSQAPQP